MGNQEKDRINWINCIAHLILSCRIFDQSESDLILLHNHPPKYIFFNHFFVIRTKNKNGGYDDPAETSHIRGRIVSRHERNNLTTRDDWKLLENTLLDALF